MSPRPPRRAVPLAVQLQVAKRQLAELMIKLGMVPVVVEKDGTQRPARPEEVALELHHAPALGVRPVSDDGRDFDPPQHDARFLIWIPDAAHKVMTHGRRAGESRNSRRIEGDRHLINRAKDLEEGTAVFRARVLAKVDPDVEVPAREPSRLRGRGFAKRGEPGGPPKRERATTKLDTIRALGPTPLARFTGE